MPGSAVKPQRPKIASAAKNLMQASHVLATVGVAHPDAARGFSMPSMCARHELISNRLFRSR
jgi:hypothetical protein